MNAFQNWENCGFFGNDCVILLGEIAVFRNLQRRYRQAAMMVGCGWSDADGRTMMVGRGWWG
jgi:hypothetical protein